MSTTPRVRRRPGWFDLYGEPLLVVWAAMTLAVVFSVNARRPEVNAADFYGLWDSARWFLDGRDMYFGGPIRPGAGYNLNAPASLLVYLPFARLPLRLGLQIFTALGVCGFAWLAWWVAGLVAPRRWLALASILFIAQPAFSSLQLGQPSWILALLLTAAWLADRDGRFFTSGFVLGILAAAKPFLGLFVFHAIARSRRAFWGMVAGGCAFLLLGLVGGVGAYRSWLMALSQISWTAHLANASLLGLLHRSLEPALGTLQTTPVMLAPAAIQPLWLAGSALILGATWLRLRGEDDLDRQWLCIGLAALLVSPLGWIYYLPLLFGPLCIVAVRGTTATRVAFAVGYALLCVPYTVLLGPRGPFGTLTMASVYWWGTVALFAGALMPASSGDDKMCDGPLTRRPD